MKLKTCSCCKKEVTTKTAISLGSQKYKSRKLLFFNCKNCNSTLTLQIKYDNFQQILGA